MATSKTTSHKPRKNSYRIKAANKTLNKKVFSWRQKVERDAEDTMSSIELFQSFAVAMRNALLLTV